MLPLGVKHSVELLVLENLTAKACHYPGVIVYHLEAALIALWVASSRGSSWLRVSAIQERSFGPTWWSLSGEALFLFQKRVYPVVSLFLHPLNWKLRAEYREMLPSRGYNGLAQLSRRDTTCLLLFLVR